MDDRRNSKIQPKLNTYILKFAKGNEYGEVNLSLKVC